MQSIGPMVDHKLSKEINVYQKYRSGEALKCPHQSTEAVLPFFIADEFPIVSSKSTHMTRKRNVLQKLLPLPYRTFKRIDCSHNLFYLKWLHLRECLLSINTFIPFKDKQ
ncbi:hypothetical protein GQX74_012490 [Glossina fuscipes]|nr:hypothetical protein GQX74_012490 [Glossina fuscipes]